MIDLYHEVTRLDNLESACRALFGTNIKPKTIIESNIPTRRSSYTTLFEATDGAIYSLCFAHGPLVLADVRRIIKDFDTGPVKYFAPQNNAEYFKDFGLKAFKNSFPGRVLNSEDDLSFYMSLAPYNPALVRLTLKANLSKYITADPLLQKKKVQL